MNGEPPHRVSCKPVRVVPSDKRRKFVSTPDIGAWLLLSDLHSFPLILEVFPLLFVCSI
jgi:hypothetical protein